MDVCKRHDIQISKQLGDIQETDESKNETEVDAVVEEDVNSPGTVLKLLTKILL